MRNVYIETLGCAKNRVDSEIMLTHLINSRYRYVDAPADAEIIIVNTCGFLASAVSESIERLLEMSRYKESGRCNMLVAVGCMVERYKDLLLKEIPEIDGLLGTADYTAVLGILDSFYAGRDYQTSWQKRPLYKNLDAVRKRILSTPFYSYLKIAEGCSNNCTFCNIPKLRGKQISRSIDSIKKEFLAMLDIGVKEVNLISQDCSSYGFDQSKEMRLYPLLKELLDSSKKEFWLRVFYTYPNRYPRKLFGLMNEDPRLVPYIDFPFQHVSDSVLKAMNRKTNMLKIEKLINEARDRVKDLAIRATFIVGFPNEDDHDFEELLAFVEKAYFNHVGVFLYSHEDNIQSYKMGDRVPEEIKQERRKRVMEAQQAISLKKNREMVGQIQKVLIEGEYEETDLLLKGRNMYQGVDVDGVVLINDGSAQIGQFNRVRITDAHPYDLVGEIVN